MKQYKIKINGNEYEVAIQSVEDNIITVEVNGSPYEVSMEKPVKAPTKTPTLVRSPMPVPTGSTAVMQPSGKLNKVIAPLPGTILHLHMKEGDAIKKGAVLLIMEAMKMENNILAEKDGVIKAVHVKEGQSVLQGDLLAEIE